MTISLQNTIINSILATLANITVAKGYQTNIDTIMRGIRDLQDMQGKMPGIALWKERNNRVDDYQTGSQSILVLHVWGFVKVDARNNDYDALDKFAADVEAVLTNATYNSYRNDTFIRDTVFFEGGADNNHGIFDMVVDVRYFYDMGDI
jgi:hypothetical protein